MSAFDDAFETLIGHEGGYTHHPKDPGGATKFGITQRSYPGEDIRGMTLERAKAIYRRDFWDKVHGDDWPYVLAFQLFDAAVNSGPSQAVKWLQAAVGTTQDGKLGPITWAAVQALPPSVVAARMTGHRLIAMTDMRWSTFGKGWARRIGANLVGMS